MNKKNHNIIQYESEFKVQNYLLHKLLLYLVNTTETTSVLPVLLKIHKLIMTICYTMEFINNIEV